MNTFNTTDVAIIGNRLSGNLMAAYLRTKIPNLKVTAIAPKECKIPIVGESTIEATALLFDELGLLPHLQNNQLVKYGQTFYYKLDEMTYSTHEPTGVVQTKSWQLNRDTFDPALKARASELGVEWLEGVVTDITIGAGTDQHQLTVRTEEGDSELKARWVVDASGRQQFLRRKLKLDKPLEYGQRSSFWFRLADFDQQQWLNEVNLAMPEQDSFDSFYCTHNFMGRGNWIWGIPLATKEHKNLISIGITWRPDIYGNSIKNMDDFHRFVSVEHPWLSKFVKSGEILDTSSYRNYMYVSKRVYSTDGWFLIGDAAMTNDPYGASGISFTTLAIRQITDIIRRESKGEKVYQLIEDANALFLGRSEGNQDNISTLYSVMHDPIQSHIFMHWNTIDYFYQFLPMLAGDHFLDPDVLQRIARHQGESRRQARWELLDDVSRAKGSSSEADMLYIYDKSINYEFDRDNMDAKEILSRGLKYSGELRLKLLRMLSGKELKRQAKVVADDHTAETTVLGLLQSLGRI